MKDIILLKLAVLLVISSVHSQSTDQAIWADFYNKKLTPEILDLYHAKAGVNYGDGFYNTRQDIYTSLINLKSRESQFDRVDFIARDTSRSGDVMEIGLLRNSDDVHLHITGWRNTKTGLQKELEFIWPADVVELESNEGIDQQRENWTKFSNAHDAELLVNNVYSVESIYYNNGQKSVGRSEIIPRYSYMNNDWWSISLHPVKTVVADSKFAFEIGSYQSTGRGQYMLIWEKNTKEDKWEVVFDFNF